ncbi:MAG: molybdenum cofactor guanylyltransferase [Acidobacteria bacterium]|nr:MAG: molybdenum cofactor guanylyltransferase [Acidobacteriota bacterium]
MAEPRRHPDLCAVVLAGGKSRRMGTNKAFILVAGAPIISRLIDEARLLTDEVRISANDPAPYEPFGVPVISDIHPGHGPLAGLHAAFASTRRRLVLLLACDLPHARAAWLEQLVALADPWDAVIPRTSDGRVHPLCAVYKRTCLPALERNLRAGVNKMTSVFDDSSLRVLWLECRAGGFRDTDLANINTPEDLASC